MWTVDIEPRDERIFPPQHFEHVTAAEGTGSWFVIHTKDGDEIWFSAAVYAQVTVQKEHDA